MVRGRSVLGERAYRLLREEIVSGRSAPGELLPEIAVAERLGLSRTPLREAIARLADDGLVDVIPSRPARVRPIYREEALDLAALMCTLSLRAHDLAAQRITAEQLSRLRIETETLIDVAEGRATMRPGSVMPDEVVYEAAGSDALYESIERLRSRMRRLMVLVFGGRLTAESIEHMRGRLDAFERHDRDAAVASVREMWGEFCRAIECAPMLQELDDGEEKVAG